MPTAYETYLAAKSGRSETAYQRYLRTKAGSGSANGLVDTPAQSTPEPTKRLGMGDFRQIERGGYTGEPMGVGDLRMIERNEAGARIPNEDASFLSPASVFKGAVSKLATLGERVNRGFFRPVAEKHARIQDVVEPGAERAVSRGMEYGARMSGDFAVEGIPGFANRFVNPEEYRSTAGAQAKEAGAGLLGGGKKFFAQAGEELHQTARDFGVTGEENPMRQIYHDLGADKAFDEAVAEYNQDPSGWLQTATIAKGLGKTGAGLARGVRRGFKPVEKAPVEADVSQFTERPGAVSELGRGQGAEGPSKGITPGVDVGEVQPPLTQTPKATKGTPEVRAVKDAPLETLQGEVRQMGRIPEDKLSQLGRADLEYVVSGGRIGKPSKALIGLGIAGITATGAYYLTKPEDREDVASAALGLGVVGAGLMREPLKDGKGRLTAKEMRAAKELNTPKLTGKETPGKINIDRMNLSAPEKQYAQVQIDRLKPHLEKMKGAKLTDQEVIDAAGDVKMTQEAIARSETLKRSAQILNARKNEAELLRRENVSPKELRSILETVRQVESVKTDLGREMQKLSISVDPELQSTRSALLTRLAKSDVDLSALEKKAAEYQAQGKSLDNPRHVAEFYREFIKPKAAEILDEYRYINMLSSPNTHIVNTTSNLIQGLIVRPGTRLYAGGIDAVGSKLTGAERNYYVRQVPAYYKGMLNSLSDAVKNVRDVMSGESLTLRPDLQNIPTNSKWTKWGYPVTRALEASDIFVRTLIEGAEKEALSYKAKRLGKELDLEDITAEAQHTASQTVFRGELDPSNATGQGWIKSKVFDAPASMLNRLRQLSPPFKWLVPFVQTPLNIAKQGFEYSPLGFAEFGVKDKTAQIAKASLGSTVFVGAGYIAMTNGSTWALPNGKKAREEFYAAGMKPYSLKIGDTWVSYSKLGPLAYPIALAAAMKYHFKDSPNALSDSNSDKVTAGLAEMAQFFSDQSYVQSLGNIIDAMQGATTGEWKGEVSQLVGGTGRQLIPLSALQGWVNGIIDPIYRKSEKDLSPEAILQNMQKNVIGLSTNLEPYKDRKGEISKRPFPVGNALFPFQVSPVDSTGAKTYQKNAEQLQKKRAFDQINDAIKEGRDTDAQAIIDNMKAQGIPVGTLDQFKSEYARKKTKLPKVATPKTPKIQSSVEPLPEIYSATDIERIPKDLKVEVEVTRAKTGEKHTVKMNGREAVTELHKSLALYGQLLAYLNEGKAA